MLKVSKAEEKPSLEALMERHIAVQTATVNAVREWDARRAAGEVSPVLYARALLLLSQEEAAARSGSSSTSRSIATNPTGS